MNEIRVSRVSYPPRHFLRRGELIFWLEGLGLRVGTSRRLLRTGVIPGHRLSIFKRQRVYLAREALVALVAAGVVRLDLEEVDDE